MITTYVQLSDQNQVWNAHFYHIFQNLITLRWQQTKSDHIDVKFTLIADFTQESVYFK